MARPLHRARRQRLTAISSASEIASSTTETAEAPATLPDSIWLRMKTEETSVSKGMLPEIRISEPYSPSARAKASSDAGEDAGQQVGEDDSPEDGEAAGAERGRRLLHLLVHLHQQRLHRADDEGQGDEAERDDDRDPGEGDVEAERAVGPVKGEQGQAGDDRR